MDRACRHDISPSVWNEVMVVNKASGLPAACSVFPMRIRRSDPSAICAQYDRRRQQPQCGEVWQINFMAPVLGSLHANTLG
jgi:hypothetical protein